MIQFENRKKALLPRKVFLNRVFRFFLYALLILASSLFLGMIGYHYFGHLPWIDSLLNASMILTGMGPVDKMTEVNGKLFASFYALYSGIAFLSTMAVFFAPIVHRFLHSLHIDEEGNNL